MNDPKRIENLEQDHAQFKREVNENLTMVLGQNWKFGETLRLFRNETGDRLDRLDYRVTEAHKAIADQGQRIDALSKDVSELKATQAEQGQMLKEILALLKQRPEEK